MKLDFKLKVMIGSIFVCFSILFFNFAYALSPGLSPFGGRVVGRIIRCRCDSPDKFMIEIAPVKAGMPIFLTFSYLAGSKLYPYGRIKVGDHVLGTTISPDQCVWGHKCRKHKFTELIGIVGSSK